MKANLFHFRCVANIVLAAVALISGARAAEADAFPVFDNNYVKLGGGQTWFNGSKDAAQARTQLAKNGVWGVEELRYGYDLSKDVNLQLDARVLPAPSDYLLSFKLTKNEVGSFEVGYKTFRTFYDGAGGFFPLNNAWLPTYTRAMFVDRGTFFVNGTLTLPKAPVISFKYSNSTRNGRKDSTIWGDTNLTGLTTGASKKILPNYIQLDERLQTWELSATQTMGNTTATAMVGGDRIKNFDWRTVDRNIGEMKAFGTIAATPATLVPATLATNQTRGLDVQGYKGDGFILGGKVETVLTDKITLFAGVNYRHATADIVASRLITATIATATGVQNLIGGYSNGGRPPYSYTSAGSVKQDVVAGNIGVQAKPTPTLAVELALRGEQYTDSGNNHATYQSNNVVLATGAVVPVLVDVPQSLKNNEKPWTPALDVRYTGIHSVALYGSWDYRSVTQDERTNYGALNVVTSGATSGTLSGTITPATDHIKEKHTNFKLGANWTPAAIYSLRAEVFSKDHSNHFNGYGVSDGSFYVLDFDTYGAKVTAIVKPLPVLSLTTRYIVQRGKAKISEDAFAEGVSGDSRRYQLSESVDWNPNKSVYVQVNGSIVYDTIVTAYPRVTGAARDVLHNADNNYRNGNAIAGFVLTKSTDAQLEATFYKAGNYNAALAYTTLPFGMSAREVTMTAGVKHKFGEKSVVAAKIGFINSNNDTTGGNTNYRGPLAYVTVEHAF
jgi:hypothetical protein